MRSIKQAKIWLQSIANLNDGSLDSINADVALRVIEGLERQLVVKGSIINQMRKALEGRNPQPIIFEQLSMNFEERLKKKDE